MEASQYWCWSVPVELGAPGPGRRIKTLKGRFKVALTMDQRYLSITDLMHAQDQSREFDGLRVGVPIAIGQKTSILVSVKPRGVVVMYSGAPAEFFGSTPLQTRTILHRRRFTALP